MPYNPNSDLSAILRNGLSHTRSPFAQPPDQQDLDAAQTAVQGLQDSGGLPDVSNLLQPGQDPRKLQLSAPAAVDPAAMQAANEKAALAAMITNIPVGYTRLAAAQGHAPDMRSPYAAYMQKKSEGDMALEKAQHDQEQERIRLLNAYVTSRADATKQYADQSSLSRTVSADKDLDRENKLAMSGSKLAQANLRLEQAKARDAANLAERQKSRQLRERAQGEREATAANKRGNQDELLRSLEENTDAILEWVPSVPYAPSGMFYDPVLTKAYSAFGGQAEFDKHVQPLKTAIGQITTLHGDTQRVALMKMLEKAGTLHIDDPMEVRLQKLYDLKRTFRDYWTRRAEEEAAHPNSPITNTTSKRTPPPDKKPPPPVPGGLGDVEDDGEDLDTKLAKALGKKKKKG